MLLEDDSLTPNRRLAAAMQSSTAAAPATVTTEFQVPAPADPAERQKLADQIKQTSQGTLTGPLSNFFGRPVTVSPPQQLQEPTKRAPAPAAEEAPPRSARPQPPLSPPAAPSPSPAPETELAEEVPVEVIGEVLVPARVPPREKPAQQPVVLPSTSPSPPRTRPQQPLPSPKPADREVTLPLVLPKQTPSPSPAPLPPPPSPSPAPRAKRPSPPPVLPSTSPSPSPRLQPSKTIAWPTASVCKFKPDGQNSVPGEHDLMRAHADGGRRWGSGSSKVPNRQ